MFVLDKRIGKPCLSGLGDANGLKWAWRCECDCQKGSGNRGRGIPHVAYHQCEIVGNRGPMGAPRSRTICPTPHDVCVELYKSFDFAVFPPAHELPRFHTDGRPNVLELFSGSKILRRSGTRARSCRGLAAHGCCAGAVGGRAAAAAPRRQCAHCCARGRGSRAAHEPAAAGRAALQGAVLSYI